MAAMKLHFLSSFLIFWELILTWVTAMNKLISYLMKLDFKWLTFRCWCLSKALFCYYTYLFSIYYLSYELSLLKPIFIKSVFILATYILLVPITG